ncbi:MAG: alpha/beta hydrolase [Bacillus sp. (in: Bacteria)]|nr:alpha/beta hydrolase [Bacillus sp. (in: firmicutes)]
MLIWGEEDKVVPVHIGRKLFNDLPNAQFEVLKQTGHLVTEERPKEIYEQIISYTT